MSKTIGMGPGTYQIPLKLFENNRKRVCDELKNTKSIEENTFILLQGGDSISFYNTDTEYVFRQVINYYFLNEPKTMLRIYVENKTDNQLNVIFFIAIYFRKIRNHFSCTFLVFESQDIMAQ